MRDRILDQHGERAVDISTMTIAEARATLVRAFDCASPSSRTYLVNMALTLNASDQPIVAEAVQSVAPITSPPKLRLVSSVRLVR